MCSKGIKDLFYLTAVVYQRLPINPFRIRRKTIFHSLLHFNSFNQSVLGILVPVVTGDKKNWRSLNLGYNLQAQYTPLPSVIYPWTRFSRSLIDQKENYIRNGTHTPDKTRLFMYNLIETIMNRRGIDGKECLLKSICEAAHSPIEKFSVFDEILHLLLTYVEELIKFGRY